MNHTNKRHRQSSSNPSSIVPQRRRGYASDDKAKLEAGVLAQLQKLFDTAHAVMTSQLVEQNLRNDARELVAAQASCHVVGAIISTPIR